MEVEKMLIIDGKKVDPVEKVLTTKSFTNLEVHLTSPNLRIFAGEKFEAKYVGPEEYEPQVKVANDTLVLEQPKSKSHFMIISFNASDSTALEVEVPKGTKLGDIYLKLTSGDVQINNIAAEDLTLRASSGDVEISGCHLVNARVKASSGDSEIYDSTFENLASELASGDNELRRCEVTNEALLSTASGDNTVLKTPFGKIRHSTASGDSHISSRSEDENLSNRLVMETASGDNNYR